MIKLNKNTEGGIVKDFGGTLKEGDILDIPGDTKYVLLMGIENLKVETIREVEESFYRYVNGVRKYYTLYKDGTYEYKR